MFFSVLGASTHHRARFFRAKALAEQAVDEADLRSTVFAPSIVYAPGDPWLTLLERMALLPADARLRARPRHLPADLGRGRGRLRDRRPARAGGRTRAGQHTERFELAGPQTLSHNEIVRLVLRSQDRNRPLLHIPTPIVSRALRLLEATMGQRAFATWDEAELMEVPMLSAARRRRRRGPGGHAPADGARCSGRLRPHIDMTAWSAIGNGHRAGRRSAQGRASSSCEASASSARLAGGAPDELHAQRQAVLALEQRQRDPRLPGRVEHRRERREQTRARERRHRIGRSRVERPQRQRALGQRGREQRVVGLQEGDQLARERLQLDGRAAMPCTALSCWTIE